MDRVSVAFPATEDVRAALATVEDPEIHKPITDLGMVKTVEVDSDGTVSVAIWLTVAGCPMRETITQRVTNAVAAVPGVSGVRVELDVMSDDQRTALAPPATRGLRRPGDPVRRAGLADQGVLRRVRQGRGRQVQRDREPRRRAWPPVGMHVGVVDADIYGHSIPRMLGTTDRPTKVERMIMPPQAHGVKVISIGMFTPGNDAVVWRGPMLHRALQQFLADVFWGDLDVLLLDLPPGTGDIAISTAQLIPNAEILVVTTPQLAAAEVAERAGSIALQTRQRLVGVVENMSWLELPDGQRMEVFGTGGGQAVSDALTRAVGADVPLLGRIPLDPALRESGDAGTPLVLSAPDSAAAQALRSVSDRLSTRARGLLGMPLGITPNGR